MKGQKGITLVALIITIIVMVILAGVAIATAVLDGGVLQQSRNAQKQHEAGKELETVKLAVTQALLSGLDMITEENLIEALDENFGRENYSLNNLGEYFELTILDSGRKYNIYPNGKVEGPIGGTVPLGKATVGIIAETNSTIDGKEYSSTNPLIPAGFTAVNLGGDWNAEGGPDVDSGLVIRDENDNEFVWVPVENEISTTEYVSGTNNKEPDIVTRQSSNYNSYDKISTNLQRAECEDQNNDGLVTVDDFKIQLANEYKAMADSINKYKGFYVGRYETSRNGLNPQSKRSRSASGSGEFIESAYNSTIENDWYGLYALNRRYSTVSVQGSMMWGIQFDKMSSWMDVGENTTIDDKNNKDRTCGTEQKDVIKNVYDLYGNSREWTLEKGEGFYNSTYHCRVLRGGDYSTTSAYAKPFTRYTYAPTSNIAGMPIALGGYNASRISLYIK